MPAPSPAPSSATDPTLAALLARGHAFADLERWDDLRATAAAVLARHPAHATALRWLVEAALAAGDGRAARDAADQLVARAPTSSSAHRRRAAALTLPRGRLRGPDLAAAEAAAREAVRLGPADPLAHEMLAIVLLARGRARDARGAVDAALRLAPDDARTHALAADVAFAGRRLADAERHARAALAREPERADALGVLARVLAARRGGDAALDAALGAARLRPNDPDARHRLLRAKLTHPALDRALAPALVPFLVLSVAGAVAHYFGPRGAWWRPVPTWPWLTAGALGFAAFVVAVERGHRRFARGLRPEVRDALSLPPMTRRAQVVFYAGLSYVLAAELVAIAAMRGWLGPLSPLGKALVAAAVVAVWPVTRLRPIRAALRRDRGSLRSLLRP